MECRVVSTGIHWVYKVETGTLHLVSQHVPNVDMGVFSVNRKFTGNYTNLSVNENNWGRGCNNLIKLGGGLYLIKLGGVLA